MYALNARFYFYFLFLFLFFLQKDSMSCQHVMSARNASKECQQGMAKVYGSKSSWLSGCHSEFQSAMRDPLLSVLPAAAACFAGRLRPLKTRHEARRGHVGQCYYVQ
jgi:hypothetical protein